MANHIHNLTAERDALRATIADSTTELLELLTYLASAKFAGPDNDYIHLRTDLWPRLQRLRATLAT